MKLPIGEVIYSLRKKKGTTQEQLANAVGVSTPAVSKWESGITYPDITLLPSIARYLETTIDKLMQYEEELSDEKVLEIALELSKVFESEGLYKGIDACESYIKEYPNNFLLKYRIAHLYMMYFAKAETEEEISKIIKKAINLLEGYNECSDKEMIEATKYSLSSLYSMSNEEQKAEEILLEIPKQNLNRDEILIPLYIKQERYEEAIKILQNNLIKNIQSSILLLANYSNIAGRKDDINYSIELINKQRQLVKLFGLESLYIQSSSMVLSSIYAKQKDKEKTIKYIEEYVEYMKSSEKLEEILSNNKLFDTLNLRPSGQSKEYALELVIKAIDIDKEYDFIKEDKRYKKIVEDINLR